MYCPHWEIASAECGHNQLICGKGKTESQHKHDYFLSYTHCAAAIKNSRAISQFWRMSQHLNNIIVYDLE